MDKKCCTDDQLGITQPFPNSCLPEGVSVTPTLVEGSQTTVLLELSNLSNRPAIVNCNSILCQVQACDLAYTPQVMDHKHTNNDVTNDPMSNIVDFSSSNLSGSEMIVAQKMIDDYTYVFSMNEMDVGLTSLVKHRIQLTHNEPFKQRYRKIPPAMLDEVHQHIKQLLDDNLIRHSQSPFASSVVLVRKNDSGLRLCVDYRQLNAMTVKYAYILPRIDDLLEGLGGNKFYSVLDMRKGYHQLDIEEEHKPLTAFTVGPLGFFEYNRLPLGLSNAPATYQRLMEQLFQNICPGTSKFFQIYLDDIIIVSKSFQEHIEHLTKVFERIQSAGMKLSPNKCHLFREQVRYVGHIVSSDGIAADPDKVEKVRNWPTPTDAEETRMFLGFSGYYRRFVKDYSKIAQPLNEVVQTLNGKRKSRKKEITDQ